MKVEYAVVTVSSMRERLNEDAFAIQESQNGKPFFACVADGHGGAGSDRVRTFANLTAGTLLSHFVDFPDPLEFASHFEATAQWLDERFRPPAETPDYDADWNVGAVASCVAVSTDRITVAQAGDCRLYAGSGEDGFVQLSCDHNCDNPLELARIAPYFREKTFEARPSVASLEFTGIRRRRRLYRSEQGILYGGLLPTRGFGDWHFQPAFISVPQVTTFELAAVAQSTPFALCSDGGNRYVEYAFGQVKDLGQALTIEEIARMTRSRIKDPSDDVTIIYFRVVP